MPVCRRHRSLKLRRAALMSANQVLKEKGKPNGSLNGPNADLIITKKVNHVAEV